jgi:prepilin-type N-terminal cleavage/methylation domain-containing protein
MTLKRAAFTLVELLIVIIILAVIGTIAIGSFRDGRQRGEDAALKSQLQLLRSAAERFRADVGLHPFRLDHLWQETAPAHGLDNGGITRPLNAANWRGPYVAVQEGLLIDFMHYGNTHPNVGRITCVKPGTASDGTAYSSW